MEKIKKCFLKYKEYVLYILFGVITTIVNYAVYALCFYPLSLSGGVSNIIAWIAAVIVAYVTNKIWVFESKSWKIKIFAREFGEFALGRLATGFLETVVIAIFVDRLGGNGLIWKIITSLVVMVLNYLVSKLIVFRKKKKTGEKDENI